MIFGRPYRHRHVISETSAELARSAGTALPFFRQKHRGPELRGWVIKLECHSVSAIARPLCTDDGTGLLNT